METKTAIDILKTAILMEKRGKAFYETVAAQTQNEEVKRIFITMAEEEQTHIEFLSKQFVNYQKNKTFSKISLQSNEDELILNKAIQDQISAASYEAAAISAAIDMEKKAIEVYSQRAKEATDPNEKEIFDWLANWEKSHFGILLEMNKALTEKAWYDNNFWPY